ncbi:putative uncharacterized domain protein [Janthinobacterium agaricidamnosum NBRC 102515 = DSM 9628]|uniref:Uncharacterized domain protein n=2 Tax=Janthinobacterium agaricidamnosum TaxID=55508 RepID=W0V5X5_9BURK|nr:putative uncharacterized domain protein [Janthinobacterium agaricidamnosum NBRC 102515 = DSM 9628]
MAGKLCAARCLFALLACVAGSAAAQSLVDPTRPADAPPAGAAAAAAAAGPVLPQIQSLLVSDQRRVAVIDGQTVRIGDKVGAATVVNIGETTLVLRRGKKLETLRLYPKAAEAGDVGKKQTHATQ